MPMEDNAHCMQEYISEQPKHDAGKSFYLGYSQSLHHQTTLIDCSYFHEVLSCGIQCECGGSVGTDHLLRHVHKDEVVSDGYSPIIQGRIPV